MGLPLTLITTMLLAASPLLGLVAVTRLPALRKSAWRTAFATLGAGLVGCVSTMAAVFICASGLAQSMPGNGPKCVTGAGIFLPIGALFTCIALLTGVVMTLSRTSQQQHITSPSAG
jgi:hypothetical protein